MINNKVKTKKSIIGVCVFFIVVIILTLGLLAIRNNTQSKCKQISLGIINDIKLNGGGFLTNSDVIITLENKKIVLLGRNIDGFETGKILYKTTGGCLPLYSTELNRGNT